MAGHPRRGRRRGPHKQALDLCLGTRRRCRRRERVRDCSRSRIWPSAGDRTTGRRRAGQPVRHHRRRRRRPDRAHRACPAADARDDVRSRPGDPDLAGRLRTCVRSQNPLGGRANSPTVTSWTSRRGTASTKTAPWPRDYELVPLPRTGTVYTEMTVHMPVPGLRTPYSLVIVELDDVEVRALVKVTGAEPGSVGDRRPRAAGAAPGGRAVRGSRLRLRVPSPKSGEA